MTLTPLADSAVLIEVGGLNDSGTAARLRGLLRVLAAERLEAVTDIVPAFTTIGVFYDLSLMGRVSVPGTSPQAAIEAWINDCASRAQAVSANEESVVEWPVCYGGEHGPDLAAVAVHAGLIPEEVVRLHSETIYDVGAVGFAPGFPYLRGLPAALHMPRRATPRTRVPAGSVGIGGAQTGIYPLATPGGWNLIGRTPVRLFQPEREPPTRLKAGDRVRFRAISEEEFAAAESAEALQRAESVEADEGSRLRKVGESNDAVDVDERGSRSASAVEIEVAERANTVGAPTLTQPAIEVLRAGVLTTVQDLGRAGYQHHGVPVGGAADMFAARVANALVGNPEDAALLEGTLVGPELRFPQDSWIAVTGASVEGVQGWRPLRVHAGETVVLSKLTGGARVYLAIAGGIVVPRVLGGCGTYLAAELGGWAGRALRTGDLLPVGPTPRRHPRAEEVRWAVAGGVRPKYAAELTVRVLPGPQWAWFEQGARQRLFEDVFRVSAKSDRMGLRLAGPAVEQTEAREMASEAVALGSIQVPPDGQPIVLLADRQTIGGYPKIGAVASVDVPLLAQLRPGDAVRFTEISVEVAQQLYVANEQALARLRAGLAFHFE